MVNDWFFNLSQPASQILSGTGGPRDGQCRPGLDILKVDSLSHE
jgi:hypothetical protein